ncbi:uncharacterized, partial [Tachysurus ichikawai]
SAAVQLSVLLVALKRVGMSNEQKDKTKKSKMAAERH